MITRTLAPDERISLTPTNSWGSTSQSDSQSPHWQLKLFDLADGNCSHSGLQRMLDVTDWFDPHLFCNLDFDKFAKKTFGNVWNLCVVLSQSFHFLIKLEPIADTFLHKTGKVIKGNLIFLLFYNSEAVQHKAIYLSFRYLYNGPDHRLNYLRCDKMVTNELHSTCTFRISNWFQSKVKFVSDWKGKY